MVIQGSKLQTTCTYIFCCIFYNENQQYIYIPICMLKNLQCVNDLSMLSLSALPAHLYLALSEAYLTILFVSQIKSRYICVSKSIIIFTTFQYSRDRSAYACSGHLIHSVRFKYTQTIQ